MQTYQTTSPVHAVIDVPAGRIRVNAGEHSEASVEVRPADPAKPRDVRAAEQMRIAYDAGTLTVAAAPPRYKVLGTSGNVEVTLTLPAGSGVHATSAAAELRTAGRLGAVSLEAAMGQISLDEAASVNLTLQHGNVKVARLTGPARITTQAGNIDVTAAAGLSATLDACTTLGRIYNTLKNTAGAAAPVTIRATTQHGDITAHSAHGA